MSLSSPPWCLLPTQECDIDLFSVIFTFLEGLLLVGQVTCVNVFVVMPVAGQINDQPSIGCGRIKGTHVPIYYGLVPGSSNFVSSTTGFVYSFFRLLLFGLLL